MEILNDLMSPVNNAVIKILDALSFGHYSAFKHDFSSFVAAHQAQIQAAVDPNIQALGLFFTVLIYLMIGASIYGIFLKLTLGNEDFASVLTIPFFFTLAVVELGVPQEKAERIAEHFVAFVKYITQKPPTPNYLPLKIITSKLYYFGWLLERYQDMLVTIIVAYVFVAIVIFLIHVLYITATYGTKSIGWSVGVVLFVFGTVFLVYLVTVGEWKAVFFLVAGMISAYKQVGYVLRKGELTEVEM